MATASLQAGLSFCGSSEGDQAPGFEIVGPCFSVESFEFFVFFVFFAARLCEHRECLCWVALEVEYARPIETLGRGLEVW